MGIRKRRIQANYLKVNGSFEVLGTGFTELTESPSAQAGSKRYINQSSASQSITGYEWSSSFNTDQIVSDVAVEYIRDIGEMLRTGSDAESEILFVDLDKPGTASNTFRARKIKVAISVDSFDDNDGELAISGSFLGIGDPVEGTFNTETRSFTEGFTGKTLEFSYTATGSVTAISVSGIAYNSTGHKFTGIPANTTSFTFKDGTTDKTATLGSSWTVA